MTTMTLDGSGIPSDADEIDFKDGVVKQREMPRHIQAQIARGQRSAGRGKLVVSFDADKMQKINELAAAEGLTTNEYLVKMMSSVIKANNLDKDGVKVSTVRKSRVLAASDVITPDGTSEKSEVKTPFSIRVEGTPNMDVANKLTPFLHPAHLTPTTAVSIDEKGRETPIETVNPNMASMAAENSNFNRVNRIVSMVPEVVERNGDTFKLRFTIPAAKSTQYLPGIVQEGLGSETQVVAKEGELLVREYDIPQRKLVVEDGETVVIDKKVLDLMQLQAETTAKLAAQNVDLAGKALEASKKKSFSLFNFNLEKVGDFFSFKYKSNNEAEKEKEPDTRTFTEKCKTVISDAGAKGLKALMMLSLYTGIATAALGVGHLAMPDTIKAPTEVYATVIDASSKIFFKTVDEGKVEVKISKEGPELTISTADDKKDDAKADSKDSKSEAKGISGQISAAAHEAVAKELQTSLYTAVQKYDSGNKDSVTALKAIVTKVKAVNALNKISGDKMVVEQSAIDDIEAMYKPAPQSNTPTTPSLGH